MQKTYCNICGKEFSPREKPGGLMRNKEQYPVIPLPKSIGPEGNMPNAMVQKKIVQEVWDLCTECSSAVWNFAEQRQKEIKNREAELKSQEASKSTLVKK